MVSVPASATVSSIVCVTTDCNGVTVSPAKHASATSRALLIASVVSAS